jgi:hypothetical protein
MRVEWLNVFYKDSSIMQEKQNFLKNISDDGGNRVVEWLMI